MARLPQPGADAGNWGQILNEFLNQTHEADGSLKQDVITNKQLAPNAVNTSALGATGGIDGQVLVKDSAEATGLAWRTVAGSGPVPVATATQSGTIQLAGDLSGVASAPTVSKVNGVSVTGTPSTGQVLKATSATAASWQTDATGSGAVTSVAGRTGAVVLTSSDVGLNNAENTSDLDKPISTATQAALDAKADTATTYTRSQTDTLLAGKSATTHTHTLDSLSDVTASGATNGQSLVFNSGTWGPGDVGTGSTVTDATSSAKGVVQLSGDFGGTAASPTVTGIQGTAVTATAPSDGQVLTYNGASAVWSTPGGGGSGGAMNVTSVSTNYTAQAGDYILLDLSGGGRTITTPPPANGAVFSVKKIDGSAYNVTVVPSSGNIDGYMVEYSFPVTDRGISQDFLSNGTNWYLV